MTDVPTTGGNSRKRNFGATFRTLHDITSAAASDSNAEGGSSAEINGKIRVQHIPSLPNDKEAAAILRRIHSEFRMIIERRGWDVVSITEMCCCGDGVDCWKKRKGKVMPNNVLGYNRTSTSHRGKIHDIHLRLRHPHTHEMLDYESIAATMCHELAHCVRGPHDAKFYSAMAEIEEQYAIYLVKGVVVDKDGFPIGGNDAHVLGGRRNAASSDRRRALDAAESRRKRGLTTQGYVLGGGASSKSVDPREAARIAAERRLQDSQYCLPCSEVIEILGDSDSDEEEVQVVDSEDEGGEKSDMDKKPKAKPKHATTSCDGVIDLTSLDDSFTADESSKGAAMKRPAPSKRRSPESASWTCPRCTLSNRDAVLVCEACHLERPCSKTVLEKAQELQKEDAIAEIKKNEVERSRLEFGFNIYGDKKTSSSTMKHLT